MDKKIEIAKELGLFYNRISPQVKDKSLQYYFSGSLAAMILGNALEIVELDLDDSNQIIGEKRIIISEEQREKIRTFSRKIGSDIDVVNVNGDLFYGSPVDDRPHIKNVVDNVENIYDLMSWQENSRGTAYIDNLESEREFSSHPVVKVITDEGDVYVTAPPELLAHKLSETMFFAEQLLKGKVFDITQKKYDKDIKDISSLFYGFYELYGDDYLERVFKVLITKTDGKFYITANEDPSVQDFYKQELFEKIKDDCLRVLENTDSKTVVEFLSFIDNLVNMRQELLNDGLPKKTR